MSPQAKTSSPFPAAFLDNSKGSVTDARLHRAIDNAALRFLDTRARVFASFSRGEALRQRARALKCEAMNNLAVHLQELEAKLSSRGVNVHWARDAAEAREIVLEIARQRQVKHLVKGKSMLTEEIELNAALEKAGIEVVETDLGEYVVQLAGERPSHIITPAIHKSQQEIAELFQRRLGSPLYDTAEELAGEARRTLRKKFLEADMGITGVNFAVAETGTLVVIENEGNGRMASTLPDVYVAVMGIEKVIPKIGDLATFLDLLPRSATGQKLTAYVSCISEPAKSATRTQEMHLLIVDNGRTGMLADPVMREALYCLRCGACLNACPVYRKVGGHAYGYAYSGPIGAVLAPNLLGLQSAADIPFASTLCGACRDVCPVKIDIPWLLLELRRRVAERQGKLQERALVAVWGRITASSFLYRLASWGARRLQPLLHRPFLARRIPLLASWYQGREIPRLAPKRFASLWRKAPNSDGGSR